MLKKEETKCYTLSLKFLNKVVEACMIELNWKYVWVNFKISTQEIFYKYLVDWWRGPIYRCYSQTRSIIRWLPILWKDRNWDHWYILEILKHKIRFQREHITKENRHASAHRDGRNMRIAEALIDRIQKCEYVNKDWEEHFKQYPSRWACKDIEKELNRPNKPGEREDILRIGEREKYMKNQDYDYLFKHLKKHMESWWN